MYKDIKREYNINIKEMLPENPKEIMVAIHGFAGDKESSAISMVAEELMKQDIGVIALDLPGHGASEVDGDYLTLDNCLADIRFTLDYAKENFKDAKISLFATSFGAYLTLLLLTRYGNEYNKVVLRCPAIRMDKIFEDEILVGTMDEFKEKGYVIVGYERELKVNYSYFEELCNNQILRDFDAKCDNILIIHGDEDTTAPIKDAYDFKEKFGVKMNVVEGADHRFKKPGELEKVVNHTLNFINDIA
jgi:alpha-beta hydrolase superfamily lysophospholipase